MAGPSDTTAPAPAPAAIKKRKPRSEEHNRKIAESKKGMRHSEETKKKIAETMKGRVVSQETAQKISQQKLGKPHSDETKRKISEAMAARTLTLGHRYNIAIGRQGITHSPETKAKISAAVSATKRKLRRQRLAARAAAFAEEATADLRPAFAMASTGEADGDEEDMADSEEAPLQLDMLELEKLVIEVTALRRQLTAWMDAYEKKFGRKPDLTEASEAHPIMYGRFVRYVAVRELVRRSSLAIGQSPVVWD